MTLNAVPLGQFRFNYLREVGRGGLGRVDEVRIVASNCAKVVGDRYACKRLNEQFDAHPIFRARFEREIAAVRAMSHPGIVAYEGESLPDGAQRFYLMPLYAESLRDRLNRARSGSHWRDVSAFGVFVADAMAYAHARGAIHRDLKPENILFDASGYFVVADWGLGYFVHQHSRVLMPLTVGGMGTEYYCSLEQWNTGKCGETGDIYSLGVVLAELTRGHARPFPIGMGVRDDVVVDDSSRQARGFNVLVREMTATLPRQRPPTMQHVASRLRDILNG